ncbi:MAG: site-2 protease family protein [bacterium]|nr:site-2 protease family protein [bacterium]
MEILDITFIIAVIIFSVIIHEVMHGVAADSLGDPTARYAGRLTLNPIPHLDMFGSIILPILCALTPGGFLFGWAKPVPYNPYNLFRAPRWGEAIVAAAGPASNLALALLGGLLIRLQLFPDIASVLMYVVAVNISLMVLNLIPVPPLDGSKILSSLLPKGLGYDALRDRMEQNPFLGFGIVILIIIVFGSAFGNLVFGIARAIAGV